MRPERTAGARAAALFDPVCGRHQLAAQCVRREQEPRRYTAIHFDFHLAGEGLDETRARRAIDLADRLGFDRSLLADLAVPTPTCGLAGATPEWARRAMTLSRELGQAFVDPPETW